MSCIQCSKRKTWWLFHVFFNFHPYLGKISNLTNFFQMGWFNHQPEEVGEMGTPQPPSSRDKLMSHRPVRLLRFSNGLGSSILREKNAQLVVVFTLSFFKRDLWGNDPIFDEHFFSDGWFKHQLDSDVF